ncbi:Fur family transcriptional regulator [Butyricicoccus intestinisimiae]|uniref:Transcriptional repressor n=1 Tax=Butyricicoccus intestinisimiae TaxID=2841509 RepID=A0ABS6EQC0_9FIRM|nr:transcriptional repressor [Butyricicoccus intestinisimiae]MBU5489055.1 transcriptional repressor [Butyricicoccus intestinisimiae]
MANKSQYRTKQMAEILSYLQSMQGSHVTVHDIHAYFKSKNISVGTTTIYRHLDRMVAEGIVTKYVVDEKSSACFEYLGDKSHCHPTVCFHCKCKKCGKLIHLHCKELEAVYLHLLNDHGFQVDAPRSVIYGLCEDCQQTGGHT